MNEAPAVDRDGARKRTRKARLSGFGRALVGLRRNRLALAGTVIVAAQVVVAVIMPLGLRHAPSAMDYSAVLQGPGFNHLLGTDELGRDILSRLAEGGRLSLAVGTSAVLIAMAIGVPFGLVAGYLGGAVDEAFMRLLDSILALPSLVLALTIAAVLGTGLANTTLAIAIVAVPSFARLVRGQVLSVKHNEYVQAAEAVGVRDAVIIVRHILPNVISPVIVQASLAVGFAIITESSLSFIGLGAQPPVATWGSMVQVGFQYLELAPWFTLAPAGMIFLAVLGFNMLGEGLRQALDPGSSSRR